MRLSPTWPKYSQRGPEPAEAERGAHAPAFLVGTAELQQVGVDGSENSSRRTSENPPASPGGGQPEDARKEPGDAVRGDAARELPRPGAAHAVAHREDEIGALQRGLAGLAEVAHLMAVKLEPEEGILVVGAEAPVWVRPDQRRPGGGIVASGLGALSPAEFIGPPMA
jgi:hypothetical protein